MKEKRLLDALEYVDEKYIEDASPANKNVRKPIRIKWAVIAAAACICLAALILLIPGKKPHLTSVGGIMRDYKDINVTSPSTAIDWPWEYKTIYERFDTITFEGREYTLKSSVSTDQIGENLGIGKGSGYDIYTDQDYQQDFSVWQIQGISSDRMIAADMDGQFYVFQLEEYLPPVTFGEILDSYSLPQTLELHHFSVYEDGKETGYYSLSDDDPVWQILSEKRDAEFVEDVMGDYIGKDRISFTATSEALGVYKRVFSVSANGYLSTNIFNWLYTFNIGEKAANEIISYARKNAKTAESEPYTYQLAGTLTEINDGYLLIDDSILCSNEKDGMVFKVSTSDIRIRRCIDFQKINIGSIVVVEFTEPVNTEAGNIVTGATSMIKGYINDGTVTVLD